MAGSGDKAMRSESAAESPHAAQTLSRISRGLRRLRRARQWTQQNLAETSGLHRETISRWERDEYTTAPSEATMSALATAFGFPNTFTFWDALYQAAADEAAAAEVLRVDRGTRRVVQMYLALSEPRRLYIESLVLHWHATEMAFASGKGDLCQFDPPLLPPQALGAGRSTVDESSSEAR